MSQQYVTLEDTVYLYFAANDTSGSGGDGATPLYDVREGGAASSAIPTLSGAPVLLSHANYPAGAYEVSIAATSANGFSANKTYGVFCTLAIDSQNPVGFVGSFRTQAVPADTISFSNAAIQTLVKSALGIAGAVRFVKATGGNDSNDGLTPGNAKATVGSALSASSTGDMVIVGPGAFTETANVTIPTGVTLVGGGILATTVTNSSTAGGYAFTLSARSKVRDIELIATGASQKCLGGTTITGWELENVYASGSSSALSLGGSGDVSGIARKCQFTHGGGNSSIVEISGAGIGRVVVETSVISTRLGTTAIVKGVSNSTSSAGIYILDCSIDLKSGSGYVEGVLGNALSGIVFLNNTSIKTETSGLVYDLETSIGPVIIGGGCGYDINKVNGANLVDLNFNEIVKSLYQIGVNELSIEDNAAALSLAGLVLLPVRHSTAEVAGKLKVKKSDGTTDFATHDLTTNAAAEPITVATVGS